MSLNVNLLESIDIVAAVPPADFNSDQTGDYVSLKNYDGCLILVTKAAGTAGDDISLQLYQAQDVSATGEKALTAIRKIYYKVGTQTSVNTWSSVSGTASADVDTVSAFGTDLAGDSVQAMFLINIRASDLDQANGFDCICFKNDGTDVGNSVYATVHYILYGARYPGATPLTAITD